MLVFGIIGVLILGVVVAMVYLFLLQPKNASKHSVLGQSTQSAGVSESAATPASTATPTPSTTPAASAAPTVAGGDCTARDTQRRNDLALFVSAYKTLGQNGYYPTNPPVVTVGANDPSTGQPYAVGTTGPTALGQIQYKAGATCEGKTVTPGAKSTHYVALYTMLETSSTPYCLDVK